MSKKTPKTIDIPEDKPTAAIQAYDSGLSVERHNELAGRFNPFMDTVQGLIECSKTIEVKGEEDVSAMDLARTTRLGLKSIRIDVEKTRKELKEASMREGKAIDGMANIIKYIIVPVEKDLQEKEDFVRIAEQKRITSLAENRQAQLETLDVDCEHFDLGRMAEGAFNTLLESSQLAFKARKEKEAAEAKRIEDERIAAEKAEAERREAERKERERIEAENAELRKKTEAEEAERKKAEAGKREAEEALEQERQAELDRQRKEAERKQAEEEAAKQAELDRLRKEKEAEQARLAAPDKEKLQELTDSICKLEIPSVSSDVALRAVRDVRGILNSAVKCLRLRISELAKENE